MGKLQNAFLGHGAQADHAGGSLFGAADHAFQRIFALGVQDGDQIGAVIHGDVRLVVDGRDDVVVVGVVVLALDREYRNVVVAHQAGRHVILRGQRVGRAQHHVRAAIAQADGQVGSFRRHMQAGGNADARAEAGS